MPRQGENTRMKQHSLFRDVLAQSEPHRLASAAIDLHVRACRLPSHYLSVVASSFKLLTSPSCIGSFALHQFSLHQCTKPPRSSFDLPIRPRTRNANSRLSVYLTGGHGLMCKHSIGGHWGGGGRGRCLPPGSLGENQVFVNKIS